MIKRNEAVESENVNLRYPRDKKRNEAVESENVELRYPRDKRNEAVQSVNESITVSELLKANLSLAVNKATKLYPWL